MNKPQHHVSTSCATDRIAHTLHLESKVTSLKGVTSLRLEALSKLHIHTIKDLLTHFPRRYLDLTHVYSIAAAPLGSMATLYGKVHEVKLKTPRKNLPIVEVTLTDETGVMIVSFFRMPWLAKKIQPSSTLAVSGKVVFDYGYKRMINPYFEEMDVATHEGKVVPIHPATEKLQAGTMRTLIHNALQETKGSFDPLPLSLRVKRSYISRDAAFSAMHFPKSMNEITTARTRLVYDEVLLLQIYLMQITSALNDCANAHAHQTQGDTVQKLRAALPFELTHDQKQALSDLFTEMEKEKRASHFVVGDVGTGKTIIAAFGIAAAKDSAGQALYLAPTEILAQQHFATLEPLFKQCNISCALLTGSTPSQERNQILSRLSEGSLDAVIGTHALLEDDVSPRNLTFAVIDEQHRFGVNQRAELIAKGNAPDTLYLSATPIPRSLALTIFGNLTHSFMKDKPFSESKRITHVLDYSQKGTAYEAAKEALEKGEQVYIVCPLVGNNKDAQPAEYSNNDAEETFHPDVLIDSDDYVHTDVASAAKEANRLANTVFIDYEVGLLHGALSSEDKQKALLDFKNGRTNVLVTTTIIEVGIDVPKATVMIVEDADRFGLAQLHQLRGRIGRGEEDAHMFLISSSKNPSALARLEALSNSDDGFEIASYDLSLRREGDILGNKQSGTSSLKLVNVMLDEDIIQAAHEDARTLLQEDPHLQLPQHAALAREVRITFSQERDSVVSAG